MTTASGEARPGARRRARAGGSGGVSAPRGFRAAGVRAGLKPDGSADLALVVNDGPQLTAAGVFTTNRVQAAPVRWTRQVLTSGRLRAAVLNSGGANACTGPAGFADTHATAEAVATELSTAGQPCGAGEVAVCSTGLIGRRLPIARLLAALPELVAALGATPADAAAAAAAIRTTDTVSKQAAAPVRGPGGASVGGMAKGAAMLAPGLATMLAVLTTDAELTPPEADRLLRQAVAASFERLDVDGCRSTNDTVLLLASGAAGRVAEPAFAGALQQVCADLAAQLLADAEGASRQVEVVVSGAASDTDAEEVARAVARNTLVKCALAGGDPNWGRVLAAVGTTAAAFEPAELDVALQGVWVARGCAPAEPVDAVDLSGPQVRLEVALHAGTCSARVWTCDLTAEYVRLNSEYST